MTILILQHTIQEGQRSYFIQLLSEEWVRMGYKVIYHFGVKNVPKADVLILHIDLSVIPAAYLKVAARYPLVINGRITDIRKTRYSRNRVLPGDGYTGPVIVKSAENFAGIPEQRARAAKPRTLGEAVERKIAEWGEKFRKKESPAVVIAKKEDYRVYTNRDQVPDSWCETEGVIVERFRPEFHDGLYVLREWYFLGDRSWSSCETSDDPIFTNGDYREDLLIPIPPEIEQVRKDLNVEYGKIDFSVGEDGVPVLYDVNKTIGVWSWSSPRLPGMVEILAPGLFTFVAPPPSLTTDTPMGTTKRGK